MSDRSDDDCTLVCNINSYSAVATLASGPKASLTDEARNGVAEAGGEPADWHASRPRSTNLLGDTPPRYQGATFVKHLPWLRRTDLAVRYSVSQAALHVETSGAGATARVF